MKKVLTYMGMDRAIVYTLAGRGWGLLSNVITLLLIVRFLSLDEQGYYYTFASLLAMQVLFELGMSYVVMQFASHEMAKLSWSKGDTIEGDDQAKSRLRSLLMLVTKWYGVIAVLIFLVILPMGWWFFSVNQAHTSVKWQTAWLWLVASAAVSVFFMPMLALLEGCGRVTDVARLRMFQSVIGSLVAWIILLNGGGLLAIPAMNTGLAITVIAWLWHTKKNFFHDLFGRTAVPGVEIKWRAEIWPMQWKIALSWLSGYFIFQLFTPVLFAFRGATEAGQMGLSFAIASALMSIAMAWIGTKAPKFGKMVAMGDYVNLDKLFRLTLTRSLFVLITLGGILCAVNYYLHMMEYSFALRLLDPLPFALLMVTTALNYITYAQSTYLRAHKQDPFLVISLISAGLIAVSTITLGEKYGALGIMCGYFSVCATVGFGWGSMIFSSKRNKWRKRSILKRPREMSSKCR